MPELPGHIPAASLRRTFPRLHATAGCSTQLTSRIRRRQSGPTFALLGSSANDSNHLPGDASLFSHSFHTFLPFFCAHFNLLSLVNERSLARIGASVAVLSASTIGSSLALRSFARCELSLSVFTLATFSLPMAVRSMACTGTSLSVFICARFGASLSVRSFARFFAVSIWRHEIWLLLVLDRHIVAVSEVVCTSGCFSGGAWRHTLGRVLVCLRFFAFGQLTFRVERSALLPVSGGP